MGHKHAIAIHGGAGTILRESMTPKMEKEYLSGLSNALHAGDNILSQGGTAMDAVEAAIISLEDNPLFNAGKGSVFTHEGTHEMDAAIMDGATLEAGAAAGVTGVKNPIKLARAIMEQSQHVMLSGQGARDFAKTLGLAFENEDYFFVQQRFDQLNEIKDSDLTQMDHSMKDSLHDKKFGTVGAVALDKMGNLAAGTSTGGMTNKRFGRIGDTPIIGAGTYANNHTCAISCTGHGEYFIRAVVAYDISCLMAYKGLTLQQACDEVVMNKLVAFGGEGGLIAIDNQGNIALPFNSAGMYRGSKKQDEDFFTAIYGS